MRIAATGASGLIGSAVVRRLAKAHEVVTIGRSQPADVTADISDPDSIAQLSLPECDAFVHCAGIVDEDFAAPERAFRQATLGMAALVKKATQAGVRRFAYISSAHVYGPMTGRISEATPTNPLTDYAIAHFASEQVLRRATAAGLAGAVFRPNAVYGIPPDLARFRRWKLVPFAFPRDAVERNQIVLASSGTQRRNFVAADDVASAIDTWLNDTAAPAFSPINPVGATSLSVFDFARLCAEICEKVTGRRCTVTRKDDALGTVDTFDYTTLDRRYIGQTDIAATLGGLIEQLQTVRRPQ